MHQIRFQLGLRPRPRWGAFSAPPDSLAGFKGLLLRGGRRREGKGLLIRGGRLGGKGRKGGKKGKGREKDRRRVEGKWSGLLSWASILGGLGCQAPNILLRGPIHYSGPQ